MLKWWILRYRAERLWDKQLQSTFQSSPYKCILLLSLVCQVKFDEREYACFVADESNSGEKQLLCLCVEAWFYACDCQNHPSVRQVRVSWLKGKTESGGQDSRLKWSTITVCIIFINIPCKCLNTNVIAAYLHQVDIVSFKLNYLYFLCLVKCCTCRFEQHELTNVCKQMCLRMTR